MERLQQVRDEMSQGYTKFSSSASWEEDQKLLQEALLCPTSDQHASAWLSLQASVFRAQPLVACARVKAKR